MMSKLACTLVSAAFGLAVSSGAVAQEANYPSKPIDFMVGYAVGGSADSIARIVMPELSKRIGQTIILDNRAGAGGVIGLSAIKNAKPDGYTMGIGTGGALTANVHLIPTLPYNPQKDFEPVSMLINFPIVLAVSSTSKITSLQDLIKHVKAGNKVNFGSAGLGSSTHLAGELLNQMAGINMEHVAYKGLGPAQTDLLGGHLEAVMTDLPSVISMVQSGRVRLLGTASAERSALAPDVPTIAEAGVPGYSFRTWISLLMPAGTPKPVVNRISKELGVVLRDPEMVKRIHASGGEPMPTTPEEMRDIIKADTETTGKIIRSAGIKLN